MILLRQQHSLDVGGCSMIGICGGSNGSFGRHRTAPAGPFAGAYSSDLR